MCPSITLGIERRKQGGSVEGYPDVKATQVLGSVYNINPRQGECFYLHLLLHHIQGPQSFADLKVMDGDICASFREECLKAGLLENDNQYHMAMSEATASNSPGSLHTLFAIDLVCTI